MKKLHIVLALAASITYGSAQSDSYITLKDTFKGGRDVHHFGVSGGFCRMILALADEHEFRNAIMDVRNVKFIVIPKDEFNSRHLSLQGFKKILSQDNFHELANFRDHGDDVTFFIQETNRNKNRYFILVEENDDVVGIEIKGYVDPDKLVRLSHDLAMNDH